MSSEKKLISAGFVLKSGNRYLIGHPTYKTGTTGGWGILKGKIDPSDASIFEGAVREFKEEGGVDIRTLPGVVIEPEPFYTFQVKGHNKTVHVYFAEDKAGKLWNYPFKCESFVEDGSPEIDRYHWASIDEAIEMVAQSQKKMFKYIKNEGK